MDSKMTAGFVLALTYESEVSFYAYLHVGDDFTDTIALDKISVRLMLEQYDADYMINCIDWGNNDYLIG